MALLITYASHPCPLHHPAFRSASPPLTTLPLSSRIAAPCSPPWVTATTPPLTPWLQNFFPGSKQKCVLANTSPGSPFQPMAKPPPAPASGSWTGRRTCSVPVAAATFSTFRPSPISAVADSRAGSCSQFSTGAARIKLIS